MGSQGPQHPLPRRRPPRGDVRRRRHRRHQPAGRRGRRMVMGTAAAHHRHTRVRRHIGRRDVPVRGRHPAPRRRESGRRKRHRAGPAPLLRSAGRAPVRARAGSHPARRCRPPHAPERRRCQPGTARRRRTRPSPRRAPRRHRDRAHRASGIQSPTGRFAAHRRGFRQYGSRRRFRRRPRPRHPSTCLHGLRATDTGSAQRNPVPAQGGTAPSPCWRANTAAVVRHRTSTARRRACRKASQRTTPSSAAGHHQMPRTVTAMLQARPSHAAS